MNLKLFGFISLLAVSTGSCRIKMGIKKVKNLDESALRNYATNLGITDNLYLIDSGYTAFIKKKARKNTDVHVIKNHLQPVQCIYFDSNGYPVSYYINCYAPPGTFHLKWNEDNTFSTFPPKGNAPLDTLITTKDLGTLITPMAGLGTWNSNSKFTVVVFWSRTFQRYSLDLIRLVRSNTKGRENVDILYVNNDRYLSSLFKK